MASAQERKLSESYQHSIAMWGPPGSGKTTFLAALSVALNRNGGLGWRIQGWDENSEKQLIRMNHQLISGRTFPRATVGIEEFSWVLSGPPRNARRKLFRKAPEENVRVRLDLVDAQGEIAGPEMKFTQRDELIDGLVRSRGIVYIFDPMRESDDGDAFDHTFGMLVQLARRMDEQGGGRGARLPHYVAVCITKFDVPPVLMTAQRMGLIVPSDDDHEFPRVPDYEARDLFERLCSVSGSGNAEMVIHSLEQYFDPRRIRYFVTSAIGFYLGGAGKFDGDDPNNLLLMEEIDPRLGAKRTRIRGPVHPINVVEPIFWLIDQIIGDGNGSP
jgi:energy-coupling factor transporter ATP-binding protein EcfA2